MARTLRHRRTASTSAPAADTEAGRSLTEGCIPIAEVSWRHTARFAGRVRSLRIQPWADVATLECTLVDGSGGITIVFLGRRKVPGVSLGRHMVVEGMAGAHHGRLALLNPDYTLLST